MYSRQRFRRQIATKSKEQGSNRYITKTMRYKSVEDRRYFKLFILNLTVNRVFVLSTLLKLTFRRALVFHGSDGLKLETSASLSFYGGNLTLINFLDTKFLYFTSLQTQHRSFFSFLFFGNEIFYSKAETVRCSNIIQDFPCKKIL